MKAVIYARYSSDNQREESIEGQLRECKEFAQRKGYSVVKTYADRAISGKKADNRPEFMQMIEDNKSGGFAVVIVWKIDRFSRDKYDSVFYKNALKKNGVSVISATEPIDDTPEGQLMESIFEGFSVYYVKDLAQKTERGMTENVLKGKFNGGAPTFGYIIDENKHFQPDPENSLIVADVFARYAGGESIKGIVDSLKEQGVKRNRDKAPSYGFIVNLLKNRRYLGEYRFKETVVENAFSPLVTREIFDKCQKILIANQRKPAHFKVVEDKFILTGKIYCGLCGSTMNGISGTSRTGEKHRYYVCHAAKRKKSCDKKNVQKAFVEDTVIDYILQTLNNAPLFSRIIDICYELQIRKNSALPALEKQLSQTNREIENVMTAIKAGIITPTTKSTLEALEEEKSVLELSLAKESIERPVLSKEQIRSYLDKFKLIELDDERSRSKLIHAFLHSVHVYDDKMLIILNYKDGEICVDFEQVRETVTQKTNPKSGSSLKENGEPPD